MSTKAIGIMSGSSLDGLDIALCQFEETHEQVSWEILDTITFPYTEKWYELLKSAPSLSGFDLMHLDALFGDFIGTQTKEMIQSRGWSADFIASHGHTVFHEPTLGFTTQIGSGAHIAFQTGLDTITSFRNADVAAGGQGAPFAPIADTNLFQGYDGYLNLGGIANIAIVQPDGQWLAWDICPCNQALNLLARRGSHPYDKSGYMASQGAVLDVIRHELVAMYPFKGGGPHSLSNAHVETSWLAYLESRKENTHDLLGTTTLAISDVITHHISSLLKGPVKIMVTGGGAYNDHLIKLLREHGNDFGLNYELPEPILINFKECLLMAYLGYLTMNHRPYNIHPITGSSRNSVGGTIHRAL
jgi:anhydro-N-acetylmuramic acid kinase